MNIVAAFEKGLADRGYVKGKTASIEARASLWEAFQQGMRELGYAERQNVEVRGSWRRRRA